MNICQFLLLFFIINFPSSDWKTSKITFLTLPSKKRLEPRWVKPWVPRLKTPKIHLNYFKYPSWNSTFDINYINLLKKFKQCFFFFVFLTQKKLLLRKEKKKEACFWNIWEYSILFKSNLQNYINNYSATNRLFKTMVITTKIIPYG